MEGWFIIWLENFKFKFNFLLGNGEGGVNLFFYKLKLLDFIFYRNDVKLVKEWVKLFLKYDLLILSIILKLELVLERN